MEDCKTGTMGLLLRVMRQMKPHVSESDLGMRMGEFITLGHLRDMGGRVSQQSLGEALAFDRNNLVLLLNDLEDLEYVTRTRDPKDRRRHFVELTPDGTKALAKAEVRFEDLAETVLVGLSASERDQLGRLLAKTLLAACRLGSMPEEPVLAATP